MHRSDDSAKEHGVFLNETRAMIRGEGLHSSALRKIRGRGVELNSWCDFHAVSRFGQVSCGSINQECRSHLLWKEDKHGKDVVKIGDDPLYQDHHRRY